MILEFTTTMIGQPRFHIDRGYDVSYTRYVPGVPLRQIGELNSGMRALLIMESGSLDVDKERVGNYQRKVEEALGERVGDYLLESKLIGGKTGLVITRR